MMADNILTTIFLGIAGGLTPGPILLIALSEILRSPQKGLMKGWMYIFSAALTEFCIGLFLVHTSSELGIPEIIFHLIALFGVLLLFYIAAQLYRTKNIDYTQEQKRFKIKHVVMLMILNGPMWLFWISVCLPIAFSLDNQLHYGKYLFVIVFQISMIAAMAIMFFGFNSLRRFLTNEKIIRKIFIFLSLLIAFIALKILYSEINFFILYFI